MEDNLIIWWPGREKYYFSRLPRSKFYFDLFLLIKLIIAESVVDFPEPVGPVTKIKPFFLQKGLIPKNGW